MPTKLKRVLLSLPDDLGLIVERDAARLNMPHATYITSVLSVYFEGRKDEVGLFRPSQLNAAGSKTGEVPVFGAPPQTKPGRVSTLRASHG